MGSYYIDRSWSWKTGLIRCGCPAFGYTHSQQHGSQLLCDNLAHVGQDLASTIPRQPHRSGASASFRKTVLFHEGKRSIYHLRLMFRTHPSGLGGAWDQVTKRTVCVDILGVFPSSADRQGSPRSVTVAISTPYCGAAGLFRPLYEHDTTQSTLQCVQYFHKLAACASLAQRVWQRFKQICRTILPPY